MYRLIFILLISALLVSCGKPVPPEKESYIGYWQGRNTLLEIKENGDVSYFRKEGEKITTIDSPLQKFDGDDFVIGILFFTSRFEVSTAPYIHPISGEWMMVVNGVELTRNERLSE